VINNLIQILGQRPASGTNTGDGTRDIDWDESGDVLNDRLARNGQSTAG